MANYGFPTADVPSRGYQAFIIGTVMVIVAGIFVAVRLAARFNRGGIQVDDWMIVVSLILSVLFTTSHNNAVEHGLGKHKDDLLDEQMRAALKWVFTAQVLYKIILGFEKLSVLFFYLRLFYVDKKFRVACISVIVFVIVSSIAYIPPTVWQCSPIAAFWDRSIPHKCLTPLPIWLSYAIINIVADIVVLALPIHQVLKLQLSLRDKVGVILVFALGGFVCITSIIRTTSLHSSSKVNDVTWATIPIINWTSIEVNTGIICACLPMIRQPLSIVFPRLFSRSTNTPSKPTGGSYYNASRRPSRPTRRNGGPSLATIDGAPWATTNDENIVLTSVKPGRDPVVRRTESEERMIGGDVADPGTNGILKRMEVSISQTAR
ncbi:hypothetical protein FQN57_000770 [Myotisia sp. PD_48]|nr:hypothetical protein FQN57_000770 [Myotisia sp. PD_48]